jgi:hypothetical protein
MFSESKEEYLEILQSCSLPIDDEDYFWVQFPERIVNEIFKMQENSNSLLSVDGDNLVWHFETTTNFGNTYLKTIVADSGFPFKCPKVYVLEPEITSETEIHMYGGGELCLFRPEEYHSNLSILDLRNKSAAWCFAYDTYVNTGVWGGAEAAH